MWRPWKSPIKTPNYDYESRIERLRMVALEGFMSLQDAAFEDHSYLPPFIPPANPVNYVQKVDSISLSYLVRFKATHLGTPYHVTGNGSCLFNAVSIALCGTEELVTELRYRTCIQMILKKDHHSTLPKAKELILVSPNYVSSVFDCVSKNGWSSSWTLLALADVIGIPIKSVYPPMNGMQDFSFRSLNFIAIPRKCMSEDNQVVIMWTREGYHDPSKMWTPNHFVPLLPEISVEIPPAPSYASITKQHIKSSEETLHVPHKPCAEMKDNQVIIDEQETIDQSTSRSLQATPLLDLSDTVESELPDPHYIPNTYALPKEAPQNASELFAIVLNQDIEIIKAIPKGYKDNVFCALDNKENILNRERSKFSSYPDDCGAWDTHSGRSHKTDFVLLPNNVLKWVIFKDGSYCTETKSRNKKIYTPLVPQPKTVVTLNRYYSSLKRDKSYKKRISWFSNLPETFSERSHIAVVEYIGKCPRTGAPHGNAKHSTQEYVRTDPEVMTKIKEGVSNKQSCLSIYKDMVLENPEDASRDSHQIRNTAYNMKKKKYGSTGNVADEVISVMAMVNENDFVKEVFYTEGTRKPPSAICYTTEQLNDMVQYVRSGGILGIDRTFNLGPVFVTNFVYKNRKVIRKETGDHPIFIGPMFLHWEASFLTYNTFFSHVKARMTESFGSIEIRIGSDDEGGLTKALDNVFPNAQRLLCSKHIKDNVSDFLKNNVGVKDVEHTHILESIFGEIGLVYSKDKDEFECKCAEICLKYPNFKRYFETRLRERLYQYVLLPNDQLQHERLWTNNNCESVNHTFKRAIDWRPQHLPELIRTLQSLVNLQYVELRRSLFNQGNYELCGQFRKHLVAQQCWNSKSDEQRKQLFAKFMRDSGDKMKEKTDTVTATLYNFEIPVPQRLAKKPHQKKRPRVCRSQKRFP